MSEHTPGPWQVREHAPWIIDGPDGIVIGLASQQNQENNHKADAQLMAAAPDMLRALDFMLERWGHFSYGEIKGAADAVAKARGEPRMSHTPGPWNIKQASWGDAWRVWTPSETFRTWIEYEPDARLIAAAPDMLEALERAVEYLVDDEQARDAIAKARGELNAKS